jgi:hypothetical protein
MKTVIFKIKILLYCLFFLAVIVIAAYNVSLNIKSTDMAKLTLANVTMLANATGDSECNENGTSLYHYCTKAPTNGSTECTLYKYISGAGEITYSTTALNLGANYTQTQVKGNHETCSRNGGGCTVFSCHVTSNTN